MHQQNKVVLFALACALTTMVAGHANAGTKKQAAVTPSISGNVPGTMAPLTELECERLGGTVDLSSRCDSIFQCTVVKPNGDKFTICINEIG